MTQQTKQISRRVLQIEADYEHMSLAKARAYKENLLIVQGMEDYKPKTITEALLDAWDEFNHEINDRSPNKIFVDDYARVELFKMMVDVETDKARTLC